MIYYIPKEVFFTMKLKCGLLGETLKHSYSKQIHACFRDYEYELYGVSRDESERIIKSREFTGLNVTIPYKELAYSLCDEVDEFAREAKSVNTITYRDGKICGANTDVFGFISMVESANISFCDKNVVILGSGGTSKTAYLASKKLGARSITVVSRSREINYNNIYEKTDTEIIVNTTPVGMYPKNGVSPIDISRFPKLTGVVDVIYNPEKTSLIFDAEKLCIPHVSGLHMLAAQGFRAAELFLGEKLSENLILDAVKSVSKTCRNIILIGMPGSGKSSVGKEVAEILNREFVDTDDIIKEEFAPPSEIITEKGEEAFRKIETEVLSRVCREKGLVIATGGGVVEREENFRIIRQNGRVYRIERDLSSLDRTDRPLSKDVESLYERRRDKYERFSDVKIENDKTPEEAAEKIVDDFNAGDII